MSDALTAPPERVRAMTAAGLWRDESLTASLECWARERADKVAAVDGRTRYTWSTLAQAVERVAHGLAAHGVARGSVVSVQLPNWNEFVLVALALDGLGAVLNPIPPIYRAAELRFILGLLESHAVVIPERFRGFDHAAMLAALQPELPRLARVFVARGAPAAGQRPFSELTETAWEAREGRSALSGTDPDTVHEVIFTSGTTGEPKGVMHTPNTALALMAPAYERLGFSDRDVILMSSTFGHQTGYLYGFATAVLLGATGVWLDVWNAETAARLIEAERVTFTMGATPFLQDLTYTAALARHDVRSLRLFICAGAPVPRKLVEDARTRLGCAISAGWGMTENGLVTCNGLADVPEKIFGTDGRPLPGAGLRIVDGHGRPAPPKTEGDLVVLAPSQSLGYFKRPAFTAEAYTPDGWFRAGDRGVLDEDGYLAITGRAKDLIIRGGENLSPAEIENLLFAHPKVASVAVVGMPDPRLQERTCAFVVPKTDEAPTLAEVVAFLETRQIARQKLPERLEVVAELPMTPSGKIQKYRLRQMIADKLAAERQSGSA
jgi:cyclohexanecarboxylate-CoA ligase